MSVGHFFRRDCYDDGCLAECRLLGLKNMNAFKKILVAYDFSSGARTAIAKAFRLAKAFGARPVVLHAIDTEISDIYKKILTQELTNEIEQAIRKDLSSLQLENITHDVIILPGKPAKIVLDVAEKQGVDLIIIGSHGHNAVTRILLGSTSESIIRHSPVPVLVTRQAPEKRGATVLVPIDLSGVSEQAIPLALQMAEAEQTHVKLVHVVELIPHISYGEYGQLVTEQAENQKRVLSEIGKKHGFTTEPLILEGKPSHSIVHFCEDNPEFGLVVMTTHHHKGLSHFLLGSVAETVARYIGINLLILPLTEK